MLTNNDSPFIYFQRLFQYVLDNREQGMQRCMMLSDTQTETFMTFLEKDYVDPILAKEVREILRKAQSLRSEAFAKHISVRQMYEIRYGKQYPLKHQPNPFDSAIRDAQEMLTRCVTYDKHGRVVLEGDTVEDEDIERMVMDKYCKKMIERYEFQIGKYFPQLEATEKEIDRLRRLKTKTSKEDTQLLKDLHCAQQNARRYRYILTDLENSPKYKEAKQWISENLKDSSDFWPEILSKEPGYLKQLLAAQSERRKSRQNRWNNG